jgi:glyoxylase I family protein
MPLRIGSFATLLQVFDMPTSLAFYRDVLGFEVASDVPPDDRCDWVMLKMRESELMLNTAYEADERPASPDPGRIAAHKDVTLYFDCEDADCGLRVSTRARRGREAAEGCALRNEAGLPRGSGWL